MKRKIDKSMFLLLFVILLATLMTVLAACDDGGSKTQQHEHTYTLIEAKAPTCTENGNIQYYSCSCGKYFDKDKNEIDLSKTVVVSTGHDKVATSWESDGSSHWHKCNNCNEKLDISSHAADDEWIEDSAATCTAKAHRHKECPVCNYHIEEEDYGDMLPHDLGEWIIDEDYTCEDTVTRHMDCANCEYSIVEDDYYVDHVLGEWIDDNEPSCTAKGHHHKECANCGYTLEEDYGEIQSHELGEWIEDSPASCTAKAHHHKECANCDYREDEDYGNLLSHELSEWKIDGEYTCGDTVTRHKDCANCDYKRIEENYYIEHVMSEWIEDSPASCTVKAHHHKECANCDHREDEDYGNILSHSMSEWIEDTPASCTAKAHHHKECANCDHREDEDYGNLLSHELSEWKIDGEYKCGDIVTRYKDCANCNYQQIEENYYIEHVMSEWMEDTPASCTAKAHHHKECANCDHREDEDYGKLLPHELHEWTRVEPTCTSKGQKYQECVVCKQHFNVEEIDMLLHNLGEWQIDGEYTCGDIVTRHKDCANCNYQQIEENYYIEHVMSEWIEDSPASCIAKAHHHKECANCDHREDEDYGNMLSHEMSEWQIDGKYTCGDTVTRHKDCANCDYSERQTNYVVSHQWDSQYRCVICGIDKPVIEKDGKIYFGDYPRTKVTNNGIIATLSQMSGNRPVQGNAGKWMDYGYYVGTKTDSVGAGGVPTRTEYMWYLDMEYNGVKYRGVYFTSYRPYTTSHKSLESRCYQDDNGYLTNALYWFIWERIEWRILEKKSNEALLMSNVILDSQHYYKENAGIRTDVADKNVSLNNYKESDIRRWLNETFYNWAFDSIDKNIIKTTLIDNSAASTSSANNKYACESTKDNVFLLCYKDILNTNYGFTNDYVHVSTIRQLKTTDYAQSQGAYTEAGSKYKGCGDWWLRSPDDYPGNTVCKISYSGVASENLDVASTCGGVVPAIKIALDI